MLIGLLLTKAKSSHGKYKPLAAVGFSRFDITGNFSQFSGTIGVLRLLLMLSRLIFPNVMKSSGNTKSLPEGTQPTPIFCPSLLVSHTWMSFFVTAWPMLLSGLICDI